jgi:hypothetical protein
MGQHKDNPVAVLHSAPRSPEYQFGHQINGATVPNEQTENVIADMVALAESEGRPPPTVQLNVDQQDYIIFIVPMVSKKSLVALDPNKVPWATWRGPVLARIPMAEMVRRYEDLIAKEAVKV